MSGRPLGRLTVALVVAVLTAVGSVAPASAGARAIDPTHLQSRLVTSIDTTGYAFGAFAESMAPDGRGNLVMSVTYYGEGDNDGQVVRVSPDGTQQPIGPRVDLGPYGQLMGVAVDATGRVVVAVLNFALSVGGEYADSPATGVYRMTPAGLRPLMALPASSVPNGLLVRMGTLFVADSAAGAVWRGPAHRQSNPTQPWLTSELLAPVDFLGANGIAARHGSLYVTSYDQGMVVRVPLRPDGSPGEPSVYAQGDTLVRADGIAFDAGGRLWVTVNPVVGFDTWAQEGDGSLVVVATDGSLRTATTPAGSLDYPTQPTVLGGTVYVSNGSYVNGTPNLTAFTS